MTRSGGIWISASGALRSIRSCRRLRCPKHGVYVQAVPFARDGAQFTRDFEDLVAWLMTKTDRTATCRLVRIDWATVGRIIERVGVEVIDGDRLHDLFQISIDEVASPTRHRYLTLIADHLTGRVVWGYEGKGQAAADRFLRRPHPETTSCSRLNPPNDPSTPSSHITAQSPRSWFRWSLSDRTRRPRHPGSVASARPRHFGSLCVPGQTACVQCASTRAKAKLSHYEEYVLYEEAMRRRPGEQPLGHLPNSQGPSRPCRQ